MSVRSGLGSQLTFGEEATYGTYAEPTRALEFLSESLTRNMERIRAEGIRRGSRVRRTGRWVPNRKGGAGGASFDFATKGFGILLKHALGTSAISTPPGATDARLHRYTLGDLDDLSLTVQKGVPDTDTGTVHALTFLGVVITEWELSVDVDGLLKFNPTFDAGDFTDTEALAVPTYPAADEVFGYQDVEVTLDGGVVTPTSLSITCGQGLKTDRYYVSRTTRKRRPIPAAMADLGGTMTFEFESMAVVDRFLGSVPGSEVPLIVDARGDEIDAGVAFYGLNVNMPAIRFDDGFPVVQGPDVITVTAPFEVLDNTTDEPITVDYTTTDVAD